MNTDKIRGVLNLVFMILAVASVIVYFACDDHKVFMYTCGIAICIKIMEFFIRFTNR
ncbi:MAG: hypothetical protein IKK07_05860 [Bacteroides sp.]|nr:hypothetical protein [Bacteroides sp.]